MGKKVIQMELARQIKRLRQKADEAGWKVSIHDAEHIGDYRVAILDYSSGEVAVGVLDREMIEALARVVDGFSDKYREGIINEAARLVRDFGQHKQVDQHDMLTIVTMYFLLTQTCQAIRDPEADVCLPLPDYLMMVVHYPGDERGGLLRPFSVMRSDPDMPDPEDVYRYFQPAIDRDRAVHPEYFGPSAEIKPFPGGRS